MKERVSWFFLHILRLAAKLQLLKNRPLVIGVTGSAGKTSTQHALVAALEPEFTLHYKFNANSETGLPLSILGITPASFSLADWLRIFFLTFWKLLTNWKRYTVLVAEMGIDSPFPPKNMGYLLTIVQPDIGIILNAAPMHSEPFDVLATETDPQKRRAEITRLIAREKGKIVTTLPSSATAIVNSDQAEIRDLIPSISATCVTFGSAATATIQIQDSQPSTTGTTFHFRVNNKAVALTIPNHALAHHYGYSFAVALEVALKLNVPLEKAVKNIAENLTLEPGRSTLLPGKNGSTILDSSYNSSAKPTIEMLEMLPKLKKKRALALLGDIREIGTMAELEHQAVAKAAAIHCSAVFLVGPQMKRYALGYLKSQNKTVQWFKTAQEAATYLESFLQPDDILLVKSSQNTLFLETAVELLMEHPEDAEKLLCRRGAFWDKKRAELQALTQQQTN